MKYSSTLAKSIGFFFFSFLIYFHLPFTATSQERPKITSNDEVVIRRKAISIIDDLAGKYNQLLEAESEDRRIIIENMILPGNGVASTFIDDQVYIEDDFNTRELSTKEIPLKKVDTYFKDLCFNYGRDDNGEFRNEGKNIILSNLITSKIMSPKPAGFLFIKVYFDISYTGVDKRTSLPFPQPRRRTAEIRIDKVQNVWQLSVMTIRNIKNEEPDFSGNVAISPEALTLDSRKTLLEIEDKVLSKVIIKSNVNSARVKIDGTEIGYLKNGKLEYFVKPGIYKFELSMDKFETSVLETLIRLDSTVTVDIPLKSTVSKVSFKVEPEDASVLINGKPIGTGTFTTEVPKGRHEIIIDKTGYRPEKSLVDFVSDELVLDYRIFKITKRVELITNPVGALVKDNQDTLGLTPLTVDMSFGEHNLIFFKPDYLTRQMLVNVENSGVDRYDVLLELNPELLVKREANKIRGKHISNTLINGALAGASYLYGFKYFQKKLEKNDPKDNTDMLKVGKYATLGLSGIFALSSTINLIQIFTVNKSKLLRKKIEEKNNISFSAVNGGGILTYRTSF